MSMVEDVRQVIQDFLAPELRAIIARLDAQDKIAESRYREQIKVTESASREVKARFGEMEARFREVLIRMQAIESKVDANDASIQQAIAKLTQDFQFDKRLTEIEQEMRRGKAAASTSAA